MASTEGAAILAGMFAPIRMGVIVGRHSDQ